MAQEHETLKYTQEILDWMDDAIGNSRYSKKALSKTQLDGLVEDIIRLITQQVKIRPNDEGLTIKNFEQIQSYKQLVQSYTYHVNVLSEIDKRLKARHHFDLRDKRRDLRYRLYNKLIGGVVIVFFVLLTGFLAKLWEIPLPMLRLVGQ